MTKLLKGDPFVNRIRITGTLTTRSPLHIGTGEVRYVEDPREPHEQREVSTIIRDHRGKPLIPGSSLRGVMRHWLFHILRGIRPEWGAMPDRSDLLAEPQSRQIEAIRREFSWLELLFGATMNAGKIEVWDAVCLTDHLEGPEDNLVGWDPARLTYMDTSVAIDPETGTAMDKLLYKADVAPPGVRFRLTITGQNLADEELGLVLLALKGFNSQIYPIRVGARGARGYGLMRFEMGDVYYLDRESATSWLEGMLQGLDAPHENEAGYFALPRLDDAAQADLIQRAKAALLTHQEARSHV